MRNAGWKRLTATTAAWVSVTSVLAAQAPTEKGRLGLPLTEITKPWTGDLDGMIERRMIRVLTTYSKTQYYVTYLLIQGEYLQRRDLMKKSTPPANEGGPV